METVIFDMDGTLIDTEKYYRIFWPKALAAFGYQMSDEQALSMRSLGRPFAAKYLKEMFGEEVDYVSVRNKRKELMDAYIEKQGIELKKGAIEILRFLQENGVQTAIATATEKEKAEIYLKELGIRSYFQQVISASMVEKGKPAPHVYLFACKELGKDPKDCYAVEDSPNGVKSAHLAGCKVIYIPDQTPLDESISSMIHTHCESLLDIKKILLQ